MAVRFVSVLLITYAGTAIATETWYNSDMRAALQVYDECIKSNDGFSHCLKKEALVFINRLNRMDKLFLTEGVVAVRSEDNPLGSPNLSEEQLEDNLPRTAESRDTSLDNMLFESITRFIESRTLQVTLPKMSVTDLGLEEGRKKKMKGMMNGLMMGMMGKMAGLIPAAIAGLFFLAGKALLESKLALLIAGIIFLKKLVAAKQGGGGGGGYGGGHGGGWKGEWNSEGEWDKRSLSDSDNVVPYKAYVPQ